LKNPTFSLLFIDFMEKAKNFSIWTEAGYDLFAEEGIDGIQVERLARILDLNKSGFYHYFGDLEGYCDELIKLHQKKADHFLAAVATIKSIDPEYLLLCVNYKVPVLFHLQLVRSKDNPLFYKTAEAIDQQEDVLLRELWSDYLGMQDNPSLAMRYFNIVRDMLYARISAKNLEYSFLHKLMAEAKAVMQQMADTKELETRESVF
jgi:AcrR family transcriptional regulator